MSDMRSDLCKKCIHTKVCMKDKNLCGDGFVPGNPMIFDNDKLWKKYEERKAKGFPCVDFVDANIVPKWIPVTERLPLRGDAVLCVGDNGIGIADFVCGDKWCALPWFYVDGEQETNVTHWMPLPEPPKEDE